MKYMGSKARHAKELLPIILKNRKPGQWYVEPFVGGANMIDKVDGPRIASDTQPHLISMWQAVSDGWWTPPQFVSEEDYSEVNAHRKIMPETGYIGFALSFGGKFFGGYRRDVAGTKGCVENMKLQSRRSYDSLLKQAKQLKGVDFRFCSYLNLAIPEGSIIYCDPPYAGTTKYATGGFDHDVFWQWCREKVAEGHQVFVSEYTAPDDWECIWEKSTKANFDDKRSGENARTEKLFTLKNHQPTL